MIKKLLFIYICVFTVVSARAACEATTKIYTSCKPGYYLSGDSCFMCPIISGGNFTTGTSVDRNTGDVTTCYIPSGSTFSDTTGSGKYSADCHYTK